MATSHEDKGRSAVTKRRRRKKKVRIGPLVEMQKGLFRPVTIEQDGARRSVSAIEAYFRRLAIDAARGKTNAMWELNKLREHMERFELAKAALVPPSTLTLRLDREEKALNTMRELSVRVLSQTFLELRPAFREAYEKQCGDDLPGFDEVTIDYIDISPAAQATYSLKSRQAAARPGLEVGYCRPPVGHRFKKGHSGNPSGRRKPVAEDVCDLFRASILQELSIKTGGRQTASSAIGAGCAQLLANATNGKVGARRSLRAIIVVLGNRNMLKPPTPSRQQARVKISKAEHDELLHLMGQAIRSLRRLAEDNMTLAHAARYGQLKEDAFSAEMTEISEGGQEEPG